MLIKRLAHICIVSHDLAASERFYCDVLGMPRAFEFIRNGEKFGFYVKAGSDTYLEVFSTESAAENRGPLLKHICLEVDDIDAAIADIRARGWDIGDKKLGGDNAWQAWMKDPAGVDIELMQYTPQSSQFTGEPCIVSW